MNAAGTESATFDTRAAWFLLAVVVLAAILRLSALDSIPPPLNQDEASRGYDAWAILETGADRHGQRWPLFLESFGTGDYTAALTTYLTIPFVAILGPTTVAMRLPDAIAGILTVVLLYLWLKRQANVHIALLAAGILATDPWHIALTRTAHESGFTPFFLVLALLSLHRSGLLPNIAGAKVSDCPNGRRAAAWAFLAGLMLAAHTWAYPATRLFTPLFCIAMAVIYRSHFLAMFHRGATRKTLIAAVVGLLIGAMPLILAVILHPEQLAARARVTLLIHRNLPAEELIWGFLCNYAANISPRYLFLQADEMSGTYIPYVGQHFLVLAPLFVVGLVRIVAGWKQNPLSRLLVVWLVLYPVPAAICADWNPHPMRTVGGMALYPIVTALGGHWLIHLMARQRRIPRRLTAGIMTVGVIANLAHFANIYYREFPLLARPGYQTALFEAIRFVSRHADAADFILITNHSNQPYIYVLLEAPIPPKELARTEKVIVEGRLGFHQVLQIGKYYFPPRDFPEAVDRFQRVWSRLPPDAEGIVIDHIDRVEEGPTDDVLERIPIGILGYEGRVFEIRRWVLSDDAP